HRALRRPTVQVVADLAVLLPHLAREASMKMAPKKVKALLALAKVDHTGLVRVKAKTEIAQDGGRPPLSLLGLLPGGAQHDEVIRVADDFSHAALSPGPVEGVQVDVGWERRDDPALGSPRDRLGEHPGFQHSC